MSILKWVKGFFAKPEAAKPAKTGKLVKGSPEHRKMMSRKMRRVWKKRRAAMQAPHDPQELAEAYQRAIAHGGKRWTPERRAEQSARSKAMWEGRRRAAKPYKPEKDKTFEVEKFYIPCERVEPFADPREPEAIEAAADPVEKLI